MIPEGKYRARATSGEFGKSKQKGTRYVRVDFEVVDGEEAGQHVRWDGWFTDNTAERTTDSLIYCGCTFPGNDMLNLEGLGSQEVQIVVEHETWTPTEGDKAGQEQTRAKVAWVNQLGFGGVPEDQKLDDSEARAFAQKMKGLLMQKKRPTAAASPNRTPAPQRQATGTDDDIPF